MRKFGFGKSSDGDEDGGKSGLFGRKKSSPMPQNDNPYAQPQPANDPYAQRPSPFQQAKSNVANGLPVGYRPEKGSPQGSPQGGRVARNDNPYGGSAAPPPPYTAQQQHQPQPSRYGADRYGASGGYGNNRYETNAAQNNAAFRANQQVPAPTFGGPRREGGYGGLGRMDNEEPSENRAALFGNAQNRYDPSQTQPPQAGGYGSSIGGPYGDSGFDPAKGALLAGAGSRYAAQQVPKDELATDDYGAPRELTEEEREEAAYQDTRRQIKEIRKESKQSTARSAQLSTDAVETMNSTLVRLGAQRERLHNTEKNLDLAASHNRVAEQRTNELRVANKSMFAVHVGNPFTSEKRLNERDAKIIEQHRSERETRLATRQDAYLGNQRLEAKFRELDRMGRPAKSLNRAEKGKWDLSDEDDDERLDEDGIDGDLDLIEVNVAALKEGATYFGDEIDDQNKAIERIGVKSDAVDDHITMNRNRLANAAHGKR